MHVRGIPAVQTPDALQVSAPLHRLPSEQDAPVAFATGAGQPVAGTQAPTVWQGSAPVQVRGVPAVQTPDALQVSVPLQRLPSEQDAPVAFCTGAGQPVAGTQAPTV